MLKKILPAGLLLATITLAACNGNGIKTEEKAATENSTIKTVSVKSENVDYTGDGVTMKEFVAYNENDTALKPIVPEWWGIGDYTR
jgi:hypothetical protein